LRELRDVEELLRCAIGFRGVPLGLSRVADLCCDDFGNLPDCDVYTSTYIHLIGAIIVLEQVKTGVGHVVGVQKLSSW
jgi:hypothetical protein